jgi:pSer/pThr/pTyr-binding forkhead associated (FHA) protein
MARLLLKFDSAVLKEIPLGNRPVTIGRAPDNEMAIDNLAVSNYHARIYGEAGRLVIEDLNSLNGTFVNDMRVERATLRDGDLVQIGKHQIQVDVSHDAALPVNAWRKAPAPKVDETMVLDTQERRELLRQAVVAGERSQLSPTRLRVPTLSVLAGRTSQSEYLLSGKLTVIGRSEMATVRLRGWFAPRVAAQIHKRDDGYYLGFGDRIPKINGQPIGGATRLHDGDIIQIGRLRLHFNFHD